MIGLENEVHGYCVKCRMKRPMLNKYETVNKRGQPMYKCVCPMTGCGTTINMFKKRERPAGEANKENIPPKEKKPKLKRTESCVLQVERPLKPPGIKKKRQKPRPPVLEPTQMASALSQAQDVGRQETSAHEEGASPTVETSSADMPSRAPSMLPAT